MKAAVLHARLASGVYPTRQLYSWNDRIYDEVVQDFIAWVTDPIRARDSCQPEHPHCEVAALTYIHLHNLRIYRYIGSSDLTCETCKVIIEAYFDARDDMASRMASIPHKTPPPTSIGCGVNCHSRRFQLPPPPPPPPMLKPSPWKLPTVGSVGPVRSSNYDDEFSPFHL
ncbi:hypothetical protein PM082_013610 [Marasmius tenuissimus]|nr:hypothetical protein PM082_013610 [Marasmius tenuissimus]